MADKYDAMIDAVSSAKTTDKYDEMIDHVAGQDNMGHTPNFGGKPYQDPDVAADPSYVPAAVISMPDISPTRALLTNEPPKNIAETILRGLPSALGSMATGTAGAIAGPLGAVAGAGLGATAMESARQAAVQGHAMYSGTKFTEPADVIKNTAVQGLLGAAGEGAAQGILKVGSYIPSAGASFMKSMAGIPEKSGEAALKDLSLLGRAPSNSEVSGLYDAFHDASGTISRKEAIAASNNPFDTVSRAMKNMRDASIKLKNGTLTPQEAVEASQAGRLIRDQKMRGNEMAREIGDAANDLKNQFDNFIEQGLPPGSKGVVREEIRGTGQSIPVVGPKLSPGYPEWQAARQAAWENHVASDFSSAFPVNLNGSPNQLRGYGSIAGAASGAGLALATGHPLAAIAAAASPILQSPLAYGMAIKTASFLSPIARAAAAGAKFVPGSVGAYYNSPRTISEPDAAMSAIGGLEAVPLPQIVIPAK